MRAAWRTLFEAAKAKVAERSIAGSPIPKLAIVAVIALAGALYIGVYFKARSDFDAALENYRQSALEEAHAAAIAIDEKLQQIHQGLRTISLLPSIRRIGRHAENIDADAHASIQQLYNNMASNVAVSEVYIVPADLNPDRVDPITGEMQAPILMFDELIVDAAHRAREAGELDEHEAEDEPETEIYEYRALQEQMAWLSAHYPTDAGFEGLDRPMLSTDEVITCDNTLYIHTRNNADREGILLSVPFYGEDGRLKGTISAIVRTGALSGYLPERDYALINTAHDYRVLTRAPGMERSSAAVAAVAPDETLYFSEVLELASHDARGRWLLWVGRPNTAFLNSSAAQAAWVFAVSAFAALTFVLGLLGATVAFMRTRSRLLRSNKEQLEELVRVRNEQIRLMEKAHTEIAASEARSRHLAYHDALSGLPNRLLLEARLGQALDTLRRKGAAFAVHCIDLDQFKGVNDTFGHHVGDELIRGAARRLASVCRRIDTIARLGGDEFAIVQADATPVSAGALAERLVKLLAEPIVLSTGQVHIGCSVGVTLVQDSSIEPIEALRQADLSLYRSKEGGRSRYTFFEPNMDSAVRARRGLQSDLRQALANGGLDLAYQPQMDALGAMVGVEALVRWRHPKRGAISPSVFVPLAEECGLIAELGAFVMKRAFEDGVRWPNLKVAINVSAHQVRLRGFAAQTAALARQMNAKPSQFELELTEGVLLGDDPTTQATLGELRRIGFSLALDDFGTGYSSLSYLQRYPIDKIKIDQSFVANLGIDDEAVAVVEAIVRLARALNLRVIAEGVETDVQRRRLSEVGCGEVQGYLFGKPMPAAAIDRLVAKRAAA